MYKKTSKNVNCRCEQSFTCGYCCANAKPYFFTPLTEVEKRNLILARPATPNRK